MSINLIPFTRNDAKNEGKWINWLKDHASGPSKPGDIIGNLSESKYSVTGCTVEIDIAASGTVSLAQCAPTGGFPFNFKQNSSVLFSEQNSGGKISVHLLFNPPLQGIGSQVSADGSPGSSYHAQLRVQLEDKSILNVAEGKDTLTFNDTAPFLGIRIGANDAPRIIQAWFEVDNPDAGGKFFSVAVSDLAYIP